MGLGTRDELNALRIAFYGLIKAFSYIVQAVQFVLLIELQKWSIDQLAKKDLAG